MNLNADHEEMTIFEYEDFRSFVKGWVRKQPNRGRGVWRNLAGQLRMSPVTLSQIFSGKRTCNEDHALMLAQQLNLLELEKDYFLLLVQFDRAGTDLLKKHAKRKMVNLRAEALQIKNQIIDEKPLTDEAKAQFYSNWFYSAVRMASSIPEAGSVDIIAEKLKLPRATVEEVMRFLLATGLCVNDGGQIKMGPKRTHVPRESLLNQRHHANWRLKSIEAIPAGQEDEMFFTSPMALSKKAYDQIRKELVRHIKSLNEIAVHSDSEVVACLNIDLFRISK